MKTYKIRSFWMPFLGLAFAALFIVGCDNRESEVEEEMNAASSQLEETAEETGNVVSAWGQGLANSLRAGWNDVRDASYDERQEVSEFYSDARESVEETFEQMQQMGDNMGDAAGNQLAELREETKEAWTAVKERSEALGDATADTWNEARDEFAEAWSAFMNKMDALREETP